MDLLEAYENSLNNGEGSGRRPKATYGVEMKWKPEGGRMKTWFWTTGTRAEAVKLYQSMKKYPAENEEVRLLVGEVSWTEIDLPE